MPGYTNIPKPTGTPYTRVNTAKPNYDDINATYDDPTVFYDGISQLAYTNIAKPTSSVYTKIAKPT